MVTANTIKALATRLDKAQALVADGAVFAVAGCDGYAVVRNGGGDSMYLVRFDAGRENCTCPDFKNRQGAAGLPCKHILAAELALGDRPQPPAPVAMLPTKVDPSAGLAAIMAPRKVAA
jgi:uncharacterized Zn finger protein